MTPIESEHDTRLVTLVGVAIETIQALALRNNQDPDRILAESLYLTNKRIHTVGEEAYLDSLNRNYPILRDAIQ